VKTFTDVLVPKVVNELSLVIGDKLFESEYISLISDIWTNFQMRDFMGAAASLIDDSFNRQILMIGVIIMPGNHCAEHIKKALETIVNEYDFDKSRIIGKNNSLNYKFTLTFAYTFFTSKITLSQTYPLKKRSIFDFNLNPWNEIEIEIEGVIFFQS
jgi:nitrogen regulatory protein PII-like uncharacterized protein